jgi:hypothetical protein
MLVSCGASHKPAPPEPAALPSGPEQAPPAKGWVDTYSGPVEEAPATEDETALWQILRGNPHLDCQTDPRLVMAARAHAEALVATPESIGNGHLDLLRFTLRRMGGTDYAINPVIAVLDAPDHDILNQIGDEQQAKWTHCGLGIAATDRSSLAVWIGVARSVVIAPVPIAVQRRSTLRFKGTRTRAPKGAVQLFVARPDGTVMRPRRERDGGPGGFAFGIPVIQEGRYDIELLHDTGHGPETVVLMPVFVGVAPDARPTVVPDSTDEGGGSREAVLLAYLNAARQKQGLRSLKLDARLQQVAAEHTEDMVTGNFFGHVSPSRGALDARLDRAQLSPEKSSENIASSTSLYRIHRNLWESPAHRLNMVHPEYTHVGIAVLPRDDELVATQVFAKW